MAFSEVCMFHMLCSLIGWNLMGNQMGWRYRCKVRPSLSICTYIRAICVNSTQHLSYFAAKNKGKHRKTDEF